MDTALTTKLDSTGPSYKEDSRRCRLAGEPGLHRPSWTKKIHVDAAPITNRGADWASVTVASCHWQLVGETSRLP